MSNSFYPPQIGFVPTGLSNTRYNSSLVLGRNNNMSWEAIGFGSQGRPDNLEYLNINITNVSGAAPSTKAVISLNIGDIQSLINANANATAAALTFKLREVLVCDGNTNKKMMVIASDTYI